MDFSMRQTLLWLDQARTHLPQLPLLSTLNCVIMLLCLYITSRLELQCSLIKVIKSNMQYRWYIFTPTFTSNDLNSCWRFWIHNCIRILTQVRFFPPLQPHVFNKVSVVSIQTFASFEPNALGQRRPTDGFHHLLYAGVERIWVFVVTNFYLLMFYIWLDWKA